MEYNDKMLEKFINKIDEFLKNVPEEERMYAAHRICDAVVTDVTDSHLESMGFIECFKLDFQKMFDDMCEEDRKEKEMATKN